MDADFYRNKARDELRETDARKEQSLQQLREWIVKNPFILCAENFGELVELVQAGLGCKIWVVVINLGFFCGSRLKLPKLSWFFHLKSSDHHEPSRKSSDHN
jgi:hypothetical protein